MSTNIIDDSTKLDFIVVIKFPKISKYTLRMSYFRHRNILLFTYRRLSSFTTLLNFLFLLLRSWYAQNTSDEVRIWNYYPTTLSMKKNCIDLPTVWCLRDELWIFSMGHGPWQIKLSLVFKAFKVGRIIRLWMIIEGIMTWRGRERSAKVT